MENLNVIFRDMPVSVKGFIVKMFDDCGGEDYYTVVINPRYNWEQQMDTYKHELEHFREGDFDVWGDPDVIETLRHARKEEIA